jgi:hypothetical protein
MASFREAVVQIPPVVEGDQVTAGQVGMGSDCFVGRILEEDASMEHLVVVGVMVVDEVVDHMEYNEDQNVEIGSVEVVVGSFWEASYFVLFLRVMV